LQKRNTRFKPPDPRFKKPEGPAAFTNV